MFIFAEVFIYIIEMKTREIIYMCLDLCKEFSDDSSFTEEHVLFLLNKYRALVLKQEYERQKKESSIENKQSICLDLEAVTDDIDSPCSDFMLRSVQKIPNTLEFSQPQVSTINFFSNPMMVYVTPEKLKFVNYNKFLQNIIYCALAPDGHIYMKSSNPQFQNLERIRLSAVFEDFEEVSDMSCDNDGNDTSDCSIMDKEFPMESYLVPALINNVVKQLLGSKYISWDKYNNSKDDIADIAAFVRQNMKSQAAKQIEGNVD